MNRLLIALMIAIVCPAAATLQVSGGNGVRLLALARDALATGRASDAARYADQALALSPRSHDAAGVRIQAAFAEGKPEDAFRVYDSLITRPADHDLALLGELSKGLLDQIVRTASADPELRAEALYRLARHGSAPARAELQRRAERSAGDEQVALLSALARLGDPKAAEWFAARVQSSAGGECIEWMRRVGRLKLTAKADVLVNRLADGDPGVRAVAAGALGELGYRAAIPQLRRMLEEQTPAVRMYAAVALKRLGDPSGDSLVAAMLQSPIGQMRLMGAEAYQGSKSTQWVPPVRQLVSDNPDPSVRLHAADLLASADPAFVRTALVPALDADYPNVRMEAARILDEHRLADPPLMRRLLGNDNPWVTMYGAGAALAAQAAAGPAPPRS